MGVTGDHQARGLLDAPNNITLKGKRDRAILATLLYHALRREELCKLLVKDFRHEGVEPPISRFPARGKYAIFRAIPLQVASSWIIWKRWVMGLMWAGCSSGPFATIAPVR